jgi:hypothetical protein
MRELIPSFEHFAKMPFDRAAADEELCADLCASILIATTM